MKQHANILRTKHICMYKRRNYCKKEEDVTLKLCCLLEWNSLSEWHWTRKLSVHQGDFWEVSCFPLTWPRRLSAVQLRHRHCQYKFTILSWQSCLLWAALSRFGPSYHQKRLKEWKQSRKLFADKKTTAQITSVFNWNWISQTFYMLSTNYGSIQTLGKGKQQPQSRQLHTQCSSTYSSLIIWVCYSLPVVCFMLLLELFFPFVCVEGCICFLSLYWKNWSTVDSKIIRPFTLKLSTSLGC